MKGIKGIKSFISRRLSTTNKQSGYEEVASEKSDMLIAFEEIFQDRFNELSNKKDLDIYSDDQLAVLYRELKYLYNAEGIKNTKDVILPYLDIMKAYSMQSAGMLYTVGKFSNIYNNKISMQKVCEIHNDLEIPIEAVVLGEEA